MQSYRNYQNNVLVLNFKMGEYQRKQLSQYLKHRLLSHDNVMTLYSLKSMATPHVLWSNSLSFLIGGWPWVPYPEPFVKPLENFEMKKTLVAVAALVATGAFAQVSITGLLESTYNLNGTTKGMTSGMNGGSEFRIGGAEDLGNGLKADFSWAFVQNHNNGAGMTPAAGAAMSTMAGATNGGITSYQSHVGLSGDFGSIKLGQQWTPMTLVTFGYDAMGGAATSGNLVNAAVQTANSVTYGSPSIAGVSLSVQGSSNATQSATTSAESNGYSLTYSAGAFSAGYGSNTVGTAKAITAMGASYDFGMAKLFLSSKTQSGEKDATGYGVSVPFGAATLIYSGSTQGTKDNYTLVAKYNLSKRTVAYVQNASASKAQTNSIGIQHAF
jgi:predicted porin